MIELFGQVVAKELEKETVYEARIKCGRRIIYYTPFGRKQSDVIFTEKMLDDFLAVATEHSVYAAVEKMKDGYITYKNGIRIGLSGEYVVDGQKPVAIKRITSIAVRFPHEAKGCSRAIRDICLNKNILIASPPFSGKTTFLRDLALRAAEKYKTVVIDERKEIAGLGSIDMGYADVIEGLPKSVAYVNAIRSLAPEVIVTDELFGEEEYKSVADIIRSGVKVYASYHTDDLKKIPQSLRIFDVYVALKKRPIGEVEEIRYD